VAARGCLPPGQTSLLLPPSPQSDLQLIFLCYNDYEPAETVLQCKRQFAIISGQISKFHIFVPPNAAPAQYCPGRMPPSSPPSRRHWVRCGKKQDIIVSAIGLPTSHMYITVVGEPLTGIPPPFPWPLSDLWTHDLHNLVARPWEMVVPVSVHIPSVVLELPSSQDFGGQRGLTLTFDPVTCSMSPVSWWPGNEQLWSVSIKIHSRDNVDVTNRSHRQKHRFTHRQTHARTTRMHAYGWRRHDSTTTRTKPVQCRKTGHNYRIGHRVMNQSQRWWTVPKMRGGFRLWVRSGPREGRRSLSQVEVWGHCFQEIFETTLKSHTFRAYLQWRSHGCRGCPDTRKIQVRVFDTSHTTKFWSTLWVVIEVRLWTSSTLLSPLVACF